MLNEKQIKFLTGISGITTYDHNGITISVNHKSDSNAVIKYPYEDFKKGMGLSDLRLHWLTNDRAFIAGGAVMNWVWGENTNGDIDFFFTNKDTAQNFKLMIDVYDFKETMESKYASTYFNSETGIVLQVVGGNLDAWHILKPVKDFRAYGTPEEIITNFDINVCSFATDNDYVYFTIGAVMGLITRRIKRIKTTENYRNRLLKYSRKGFFVTDEELNGQEWF